MVTFGNLKSQAYISKIFLTKIFIPLFDTTFPKLSYSVSSLANLNLLICSENTPKDNYVNKPSRMEWPLAFLKHWCVEPASPEPLRTAYFTCNLTHGSSSQSLSFTLSINIPKPANLKPVAIQFGDLK